MKFSPIAAFKALIDNGVDYVVIGGIGSALHGSTSVTQDLDICYRRGRDNLVRLAAALTGMQATLRGAPEQVPFILDAKTLSLGDNFTFNTMHGALDCLGHPAGSEGYEELAARSVQVDLDGIVVRVASLDDLISMKMAAGRPKDRAEVEILAALRDEIESQR